MNLAPQFTIVTPAFNQAQYLEQAIRSVVEQKDVRIEYFVFDGGSTDGSAAIIAKHARALADWSSAPDAGQTDAIVRGWSKAHGAYVAWLNSDDYYVPGALALVAAEFERDDQIQVVIGACLMVDEHGTVIGRKYARDFNLRTMLTTSGGVPGQPAVFVRRSLVAAVGLPDAALHYVMDWEYWLRLGLHLRPGQTRLMHAALAVVRSWPGTKTRTGVEAICHEHRAVLERVFDAGTLPLELQALWSTALAGTHLKQSFLEWQAGLNWAAWRSLVQARKESAASVAGWRGIGLRLRLLLPYRPYNWLQTQVWSFKARTNSKLETAGAPQLA